MKVVRIDMTGQKFGMATVLGFHHVNGQAYWLCKCDCGTEFVTNGWNLRKGITKSCGCYKKIFCEMFKTTHGDTGTKFYGIWSSMRNRITNDNVPEYKFYGGRGITICDEWLIYENFKSDMFKSYMEHCAEFGGGHNTTIERNDTNAGYGPKNCAWATQVEQNNNRRDNVKIPYEGAIYTYQEAETNFGIKSKTIGKRFKLGWSIEKALTTPTGNQRRINV